jgi:hypothetical protein
MELSATARIFTPSTRASHVPRASTEPSPSQNIRVATRIRPLSQKELGEQSKECILFTPGVITVPSEDKLFTFDSVFGPSASQEEVYQGTAGNMIRDSIYKGFNATILAYGQTGSGAYILCLSLFANICVSTIRS